MRKFTAMRSWSRIEIGPVRRAAAVATCVKGEGPIAMHVLDGRTTASSCKSTLVDMTPEGAQSSAYRAVAFNEPLWRLGDLEPHQATVAFAFKQSCFAALGHSVQTSRESMGFCNDKTRMTPSEGTAAALCRCVSGQSRP